MPFTAKSRDYLIDANGKRLFNLLHFAASAEKYDIATRSLSFGRDAAWKGELISALPSHPAPLCVDLACGTGDLTFALARRFPSGQIIGLDITSEMLRLAHARSRAANVSFQRGDLDSLPFSDGCADIVTGGYALRNAPDLKRTLAEVRRILKPGGTAAFLDFSRSGSALADFFQCGVLRAWGGLWGLLLHGSPEIHGYIASSLQQYPDRRRLGELFKAACLQPQRSKRYCLGMIEISILSPSGFSA